MVSANRVRQPVPVLPLGACLTAESAQRAGHEVRFLDLLFQKHPEHAVRQSLEIWPPDVVGLSIRNIDTNDLRNPTVLADEAANLVQAVRQSSKAKIVLGGAALGVMPRELLLHTRADCAVLSDGDEVFPKLLAALERGDGPGTVPGVIMPGGGDAVARTPAQTLGRCTVDDFSRWVNVRAYRSRMAAVPVQTKRGCPFECIYCTYSMAEGRQYRLHEPDQVVKAIARLAGQGLRDIEFVDNVFNSPRDHALAICQGLAEARLPVRLQSMELNPRFLDDELMSAMETAGFVGIGVTVESASEGPLQAMRKGYGASAVWKAAQVVAGHTIPCIWIFMLGGPGETPDSVQETLEFAASRIRPGDTAFFQIGTRIYPGTVLEPLARNQGILSACADEMLSPVFYFSPNVSMDWLRAELAAAVKKNLNFVAVDSLSLPLLQTLLRVSYGLGLRPPLWRHTPAVRRILKWLGLYRGGGIA
jgi:radical SAM superfamily enzyme YgiQ (UPF0313 family)